MTERTDTSAAQADPARCSYCGKSDALRVISRHRVSVGVTLWLGCSCGALQARLVTDQGSQVVTSGRA